jgi:RNA polymerase sigma-70 factor, ECF subfamily
VLGLDAKTIASAFLVKPEAMAKRLVRAKAKIKATGIRFEEPERAVLPERLDSVLEAIYAAYTLHWGRAEDEAGSQLADESLFLARLVATLLPGEPEALGLAALLACCEARRPARRDDRGEFVPLDEQDRARWDRTLMQQANELLSQAAASRRPGPYQLEAAIQAAHMEGLETGVVPWIAIEGMFERLLAIAPTLGARIGHAVAAAHAADDPDRGLRLLESIPFESVVSHQPWWSARAKLLDWAHRAEAAAEAYGRALALTHDAAIRKWLSERLADLQRRPAGQ